jgi:hypothetical protein
MVIILSESEKRQWVRPVWKKLLLIAVIASAAKQSIDPRREWIASALPRKIAVQFCRELLAMTAESLRWSDR